MGHSMHVEGPQISLTVRPIAFRKCIHALGQNQPFSQENWFRKLASKLSAHRFDTFCFPLLHGNGEKKVKRSVTQFSTYGILTHSGFGKNRWFGIPGLRFQVIAIAIVIALAIVIGPKWVMCTKMSGVNPI